jgi:hypothetical protein
VRELGNVLQTYLEDRRKAAICDLAFLYGIIGDPDLKWFLNLTTSTKVVRRFPQYLQLKSDVDS